MDKFQIETRYNGNYHDIQDLILSRAGLFGEDRDFFLNPDHSRDYNFEPQDIDKATELFSKWTNYKNAKIGLLVDPDVDGFTSATMLYKYLQEREIHIFTYFQEGKEHGLTDFVMEDILKDKLDFLIITDAGSNDIERHRELHKNDIDVLVIDHHQIEDEDWYINIEVPVINNHRIDNPIELNKELTGVGMTLRFLEYIEKRKLYEYYYLTALGQIGDSSDVSEPEIRNIVVKGIDSIPEGSFISFILGKEFKGRKYNQRDMAFSINPYINALVRVGEMDEKEYIFELLVDDCSDQYASGYKLLKSIKNRQKQVIDNMKQDLVNNVNNEGGIAVGYVENPENKTVVGLVANNLVRSLNKPVLLLRENENGSLSGSGRGLERVVPSLKDWCENTKLTNYVGGHDNAFGLGIDKDNWDSLLKATKDIEKLDYTYAVDHIYDDITVDIVEEYSKQSKYIGGQIEEIRLGFSGLKIKKSNIISRGSVTIFDTNKVEFIIFNDFGTVADELKAGFGTDVLIDVVGKPNLNYWAGRVKPQVIIEDIQRASGDLIKEDVKLPKQKLDAKLISF